MKLNIVTRCTRYEHLETIKASIFNQSGNHQVLWWVLLDVRQNHSIPRSVLDLAREDSIKLRFFCSRDGDMGHSYLNEVYQEMDGFIYNLDDDNLLHENFYRSLDKLGGWKQKVLVFNQYVGGMDFSGLDVRQARPENMRIGSVDFGQIVFDRSLTVDTKLIPDCYWADGQLIQDLYAKHPFEFLFIDEVLSYYNYFTNLAPLNK